MTAPTLWYCNGLKKAIDRALALGTAKVMFLNDTYVLDQDAHDYVNDVSSAEATGTGVSSGGVTLASVTTTVAGATNTVALDAADITGISLSACYAVVYVDTGTPSTSPILTITDLSEGNGANVTVTGITWNTAGIAALTAA
jgi:hypothetical protein